MVTTALQSASQEVLNIAEEYRQVLNLLRDIPLHDPGREALAAGLRRLASRMEAHGIDHQALLHDRAWATQAVPGSTVVPDVVDPRTLRPKPWRTPPAQR